MLTKVSPPHKTKGIRVRTEGATTALYLDMDSISVYAHLDSDELEWLIDQLQRARAAQCVPN